MFQLLIIYCTRINMAAPRVCAAYVFAYAYVIRSTRDAYCDSCESVKNAIQVLNNFGVVSGLRLNPSKTKALWLGPWRQKVDQPFQFYWPKEPIRALGIYISYHQKQNELKNFKAKVDKLSTILDIWQSRKRILFCFLCSSLEGNDHVWR